MFVKVVGLLLVVDRVIEDCFNDGIDGEVIEEAEKCLYFLSNVFRSFNVKS